jgi:hypothetical protein
MKEIAKKIVLHLQKGQIQTPSILYTSSEDFLDFKEPEKVIGDNVERRGRTKLTNQANADIYEVWQILNSSKSKNKLIMEFKLIYRSTK